MVAVILASSESKLWRLMLDRPGLQVDNTCLPSGLQEEVLSARHTTKSLPAFSVCLIEVLWVG